MKLEKCLPLKNLPDKLPLDLSYALGYKNVGIKGKIHAFSVACFMPEPILFFHLAMILGSVGFVFFAEISPLAKALSK
jgi:hypothetical protein